MEYAIDPSPVSPTDSPGYELLARAMPDTLRRVHGIDERIPVDENLTAVRFYHAAIQRATK